MSDSAIASRINRILVEEFEIDAERLEPDVDLYEDLQLDSLDAVDLVAALEREFGVRIDRQAHEKEIRAIRKLGEIYAFAEQLARQAST